MNVRQGAFIVMLWFVLSMLLSCGRDKGGSASGGKGKGSGAPGETDIVDFIDNTHSYKGKTLTLPLNIVGSIRGTLRDNLGQEVKFWTSTKGGARLDVVILIPPSLAVPNARSLDEVIVTFVCKEGDLRHGNEATKIKRKE